MLILIIVIIIASLLFTVPASDEFYTDAVIDSVGVAVSEDYRQYGWWQDYTIYAKYTFENGNVVTLEFEDTIVAEGKAESIICLLNQKGKLSHKTEEKINSEKDTDILSQWLLLAANSKNIEDFEASM